MSENTVELTTRAFKVREMIAAATEAKPVTVKQIANALDDDYRSVFQIVRKMKNVERRQIVEKTKADNDLLVYAYWPK